jgi:hypothetical protein
MRLTREQSHMAAFLAGTALFCLPLMSLADSTYYDEYSYYCDDITTAAEGNCAGKAANRAHGKFNFGVHNNSAYSLDHVWLQARLSGATDFIEVGSHTGNVDGGNGEAVNVNGVIFQFNKALLKDKLNTDTETLKKGFDFRLRLTLLTAPPAARPAPFLGGSTYTSNKGGFKHD